MARDGGYCGTCGKHHIYPNNNKVRQRAKCTRNCLLCGHSDKDYKSSSEVEVCPKCNGAFVDRFKSGKYKCEVAHTTSKDFPSLLVIELQDEQAVPKVLYKGEEIKWKKNVLFEWDTSDAHSPSGLTYAIEHIERNKEQLIANRIERRCGEHATG